MDGQRRDILEGICESVADVTAVLWQEGEERRSAARNMDAEGAILNETVAHHGDQGEFVEDGVFQIVMAELGDDFRVIRGASLLEFCQCDGGLRTAVVIGPFHGNRNAW